MRKFLLALVALIWLNPITVAEARPPVRRVLIMRATAYARAHNDTAAGTVAHEGIVAADPAVLPLGTRIHVSGTEDYDGNYLVADTGSKVKGRHIDIYVPTRHEAREFGVKTVRVRIRQLGHGPKDARTKDRRRN